MDIVALHVLSSLVSTAVQIIATCVILYCVVNFLSLKPGSSLKFVFVSMFYFFASVVVLIVGALMLWSISEPSYMVGVVALLEAALIHLVYGLLILLLYLRNVITERRF
jgi:hypothetical protein